MKRISFLSLALVTALAVGCSRNSSNAASTAGTGAVGTAGKTDVNSRDKDFVHDVALMNLAEVELGRFAVDHSADAEVKKFAQMMVDAAVWSVKPLICSSVAAVSSRPTRIR